MSSQYPLALLRLYACKVIPELKGKLISMAFYVPTSSVSVINLTWYLEKAAKYYDCKQVVKEALEGPPRGILGYTEDQTVPCHFNRNAHSSNFHPGANIALNNFVKLTSWYDKEGGHRSRVVDPMAYLAFKE